jgi:NTP pyrophosphatase (non-canonical NTP hydrolase)
MRLRKKPIETTAHQWYPTEEVEGVFTEPLPDMPIEMQKQIRDGMETGMRSGSIPCAAVKTIHGQYALVVSGDFIFPEPDGKHFYPVKPEVVATNYDVINEDEEPIKDALLVLTELQQEVGYHPGELNLVALLGVLGEAGELLDELEISFVKKMTLVDNTFSDCVLAAKQTAKIIDQWKKDVRDQKYQPAIELKIDDEKFDKELADMLYYLVALSVIRRKPLDYYFSLSIRKIEAKRLQKDISHANVMTNIID